MGSKFKRHASRGFNPQLHPMHAMLVSRTASHVASAFTSDGRDETLAEGIAEVIAHCGREALGLFLAAVWHWLDERKYFEAADAVQRHIESSTTPAQKTAPRIAPHRGARM